MAKTYSPYSTTQEQRLLLYQRILHRMKRDIGTDDMMGFCGYIDCYKKIIYNSKQYGYFSTYHHGLKNLPELYAHKPKSYYKKNQDYWFSVTPSGIQKRIQILESIIQTMKQK